MPAVLYRILPGAGLVEPPALNEFVNGDITCCLEVIPVSVDLLPAVLQEVTAA